MISKNFFRYKILNCYFTTLECKVFKICNYLKWSEITTYIASSLTDTDSDCGRYF